MTKSMSSSRGFKALISLIAVSALFVFSACMENEVVSPEGFRPFVDDPSQTVDVWCVDAGDTYLKSNGNKPTNVGDITFVIVGENLIVTVESADKKTKLNNAGITWAANIADYTTFGFINNGGNLNNAKVQNRVASVDNNQKGSIRYPKQDKNGKNDESLVEFVIPMSHFNGQLISEFYFAIFCSQGWGFGEGIGPSGSTGNGIQNNGQIITVEFKNCTPCFCCETPKYVGCNCVYFDCCENPCECICPTITQCPNWLENGYPACESDGAHVDEIYEIRDGVMGCDYCDAGTLSGADECECCGSLVVDHVCQNPDCTGGLLGGFFACAPVGNWPVELGTKISWNNGNGFNEFLFGGKNKTLHGFQTGKHVPTDMDAVLAGGQFINSNNDQPQQTPNRIFEWHREPIGNGWGWEVTLRLAINVGTQSSPEWIIYTGTGTFDNNGGNKNIDINWVKQD